MEPSSPPLPSPSLQEGSCWAEVSQGRSSPPPRCIGRQGVFSARRGTGGKDRVVLRRQRHLRLWRRHWHLAARARFLCCKAGGVRDWVSWVGLGEEIEMVEMQVCAVEWDPGARPLPPDSIPSHPPNRPRLNPSTIHASPYRTHLHPLPSPSPHLSLHPITLASSCFLVALVSCSPSLASPPIPCLPNFLPSSSVLRYGYKEQSPVADCSELVTRELLNALLWCPTTQAFDPSRLPPSASPSLRSFYALDGPAQHERAQLRGGSADSPPANPSESPPPEYTDAARKWFEMVSGLPRVHYLAGIPSRR